MTNLFTPVEVHVRSFFTMIIIIYRRHKPCLALSFSVHYVDANLVYVNDLVCVEQIKTKLNCASLLKLQYK